MDETRTRLGSVDANYYPSLDQILSAHDDDLNKFLSKTKKGNIVCLLKELILKFNEKESIQNDLNAIKTSITEVYDDVKGSAMSETRSAGETSKGSYISALLKQKSSEDDKTCEVRISGIPEFESVSSEKKLRQLDIIQHEEKAMISIMEHLEIQKEAITSATRMGKFRPESIRPRTFLVKFRDKLTAYKALASAFRLKQYDGTAANR